MDFGYISPTRYLPLFAKDRKFHLCLAHLCLPSYTPEPFVQQYVDFYANEAKNGATIVMDNSGFEMFKQGKPYMSAEDVVVAAEAVGANYIVLPDVPGDGRKNLVAAKQALRTYKSMSYGYKYFFVPQGDEGDVKSLIDNFQWGLDNADISYIGVSILAAPIAFGVESGNRLQRYLARYHLLHDHQLIHMIAASQYQASREGHQLGKPVVEKKIHFLGMVDGPNEVKMIHDLINSHRRNHNGFGMTLNSWDSSAPVWAGMKHNAKFDKSPTGLINGKFEDHVDFEADFHEDGSVSGSEFVQRIATTNYNINYIEEMIRNGQEDE